VRKREEKFNYHSFRHFLRLLQEQELALLGSERPSAMVELLPAIADAVVEFLDALDHRVDKGSHQSKREDEPGPCAVSHAADDDTADKDCRVDTDILADRAACVGAGELDRRSREDADNRIAVQQVASDLRAAFRCLDDAKQ